MNHSGADVDDDADADDGLDAVFAALANPDRRRIVDMLALQPASIQQVARRIGMSLTAINRHITLLEESGLVRRKKSGRVNFLALNRATLRGVQNWAQQYHAYWGTDDESLENYAAAIEREGSRQHAEQQAEHRPNTEEQGR